MRKIQKPQPSYQDKIKKNLINKLKRFYELKKIYLTRIHPEFADLLKSRVKEEFGKRWVKYFYEGSELHADALKELIEGDKLSVAIPAESADKYAEVRCSGKMGIPIEFLAPRNKKYLDEYLSLMYEINELIIDCRFYPLVNLTPIEKAWCKKDFWGYSAFKSIPSDAQIERGMEYRMVIDGQEMKKRLRKIRPLFLDFTVRPDTLHFYTQIQKCYMYGMYEAACVLCRAVIETVVKEYIDCRGYGKFLYKKRRTAKAISLQEICERMGMEKILINIYSKVCNKVGNILHNREKASDGDTIKLIGLLQVFLKKFPKRI